ncbi:MAG TPA: ribosome maturation factor RimM [Gammaproteobacteria bacterium]|nr:ribosome maturation factor RimM [Gammaproteobacteria bacterium]
MNVVLGKIVGVFGVKGRVKIYSDTRPREKIFEYSPWLLDRQGKRSEVVILEGSAQGKGLVAQLKGIDDRNTAENLIGSVISYPQEKMPEPAAGEFYWSQLEGAGVVNQDDIELGSVVYLFETGANDVMVVQGERKHLIPFTKDAVLDVDLEQNQIRVNWDPDF